MFELEVVRDDDSTRTFLPANTLLGPKVIIGSDLVILPKFDKSPALGRRWGGLAEPATAQLSRPAC
jgi:hypothetical protein